MSDQQATTTRDDGPVVPPPHRPQRLGFAATVIGVFLVVGLVLSGAARLLDEGSSDRDPAGFASPVVDLDGQHPCPPSGEYDLDLDAVRSLGQLVGCLETRPAAEWPIGVFDVDGRGYLVQADDGAVGLRAIRGCHRDAGPIGETTVVESLGWEFRAHGSWVEMALPGYGGGEVSEFREVDGDTVTAGVSFGGGREPGPEVELPDSWQRDGATMAVFALHSCGLRLEEAVQLIEPLARP